MQSYNVHIYLNDANSHMKLHRIRKQDETILLPAWFVINMNTEYCYALLFIDVFLHKG
jgi:hypothetical protein